MQPLNYYLSLLIRRLPLLLAGCIVGAALGWLTTPAEGDDAAPVQSSYYRATHTLVAEGAPESVNLAQLAFLTVVGDVPQDVADDLGGSSADLTSRVQVTSLAGIQVLQITAYAEAAEDAAAIANGFASSLLDELSEQRDADIASLTEQTDALRGERAGLPPTAAVELQRIDDELRIALDQLRVARGAAVPLSSVEEAAPAAITQGAYLAALDRIRTAGSLRSVDTSTELGSGLAQAAASTAESPAETSDEPSRPLRAAIGALIGLIATAAIAIALDRLDPRVKSSDDAEDVLGVPVLAQVPAIDRSQRGDHVVVHRQPHSRFAESFRTLRTATAHSSSLSSGSRRVTRSASTADHVNGGSSAGGAVILLTAPEPGDGTTTCAVNLAAAFAEAGKHVVLIDADFRSSRTKQFLRPSSPATLADALWPASRPASPDTTAPVDFGALVSPTELLGLGLLRAADTASVVINPSRLLVAVSDAAAWAARHFDVVIIDSAPLLSVNDASELLPAADTVVLVVRSGSTTRETAAQASELLHRLDARFAGTVLNDSSTASTTRRSDVARPSVTTRSKEPSQPREALRL